MKYYVLLMEQALVPRLVGPYDDSDERDASARVLRNRGEDNICVALDISSDGVPAVEAYSGGFMEPDDEPVDPPPPLPQCEAAGGLTRDDKTEDELAYLEAARADGLPSVAACARLLRETAASSVLATDVQVNLIAAARTIEGLEELVRTIIEVGGASRHGFDSVSRLQDNANLAELALEWMS